MTNIQAKLEVLFEFEKKLTLLLAEEEYEKFKLQQDLFSDQIKDLLSKHSENELNNVIAELKKLQNKVQLLQQQADACCISLKNKSLLLQRNKSKINAYK